MNLDFLPTRPVFSPRLFNSRRALTIISALLLALNMGCGGKNAGAGFGQDPSIMSFTAAPATITPGESSTLSWSASGATSMSISYGGGTLNSANSTAVTSNTVTVTPTTTTTYTLTANNSAGKSAVATVVVNVVDKPVINSFIATPSIISDQQSSTLSWSVTGATGLTINHGVGDVTGSNSVSVSPAATTTYQLIATNATGTGPSSATVIALATVTVVPTPVITNFTANPSTISGGQNSTLSWSVNGATSLSIDNGIGDVTTKPSATVSPAATTTYTLTAGNTVGSFTATATAQTTVKFSSTAVPTINSFTVDHPSVGPNGVVKLIADFDTGQGGGEGVISTNNGATVIAHATFSPFSATLPVNPSTTFTLTVKNVDGNTATATLRVVAGDLSVFAGTPNASGNMDGTGASALFSQPHGAAVDASGSLYVADTNNNTIRKITISGAVVTTLDDSSTGLPAQFNGPTGLAVDASGNVYVADTNNDTIDELTPGGVLTILAGTPGTPGSNDSPGALFDGPQDVTVDTLGNVYVADTNNHTIRLITPAGVVSTVAGVAGVFGSGDNPAHFKSPYGIAMDVSGNLYVADTGNNTIRKITFSGGVATVSTLAGLAGQHGDADGTGGAATFFNPSGIAVDPSGIIYVADVVNDTIRRITPAGVVDTIIGVPGASTSLPGGPLPSNLSKVNGIAVDPAPGGNLYINMQNAVFTAPY